MVLVYVLSVTLMDNPLSYTEMIPSEKKKKMGIEFVVF
jgi:hypothetical protein